MTRLDTATRIRLGTAGARRVYAGPAMDWEFQPYVDTTLGFVTTPDTPDQTIDGDVRVTAKFRDDSAESASARYVVAKVGGTNDWAYEFISTYTNNYYGALGWPTGATSPQIAFNLGTRTAFGVTPPGADLYKGIVVRGVNPWSQALTCTGQGIKSTDGGATWVNEGGVLAAIRADAFSRESAQALRMSYVWQGRIYWAQLEAINRAQLVFPGVAGNYLSVPHAPDLAITGDIEVSALVTMPNWRDAVNPTIIAKDGGTRGYFARITAAGTMQWLYSVDGSVLLSAAATSTPFVDGETYWLNWRRVAATGAITFRWAPAQAAEPTSWTTLGTTGTQTAGAQAANANLVSIGGRTTLEPLTGRIQRIIVRSVIGGTPVLDVDEVNARPGAPTFIATTGQTVTVVQTAGHTIVQPIPDRLVWRFDAKDYPGTGTTYVDPRGRTWTLSAAGAITVP